MTDERNSCNELRKVWQTNNRLTTFLFEHLADELWPMKVPGAPRRTIRMIAGHIHNSRGMWIKMLGKRHKIPVPKSVDRHRVTRKQLLPALRQSNSGVLELIDAALAENGKLHGAPFQNFPPDVAHLVAYLTAHESHHRGQIVMLARQLGHRLPQEVTVGLWLWSKRAKELQ